MSALLATRTVGGTASRAAARATSVEVDAVSWMTPKRGSGRPMAWRSQSRVTSSSSVAAGAVFQIIALALKAAASISPRIPGPDDELAK